jgi:hypothetical protein
MAEKCQVSQTTANAKRVREILTITMVVTAAVTREIISEEDANIVDEVAVEDAITPVTI